MPCSFKRKNPLPTEIHLAVGILEFNVKTR
nr:MAG TPA: hypothetical protein [Caudoviricetes sp.]